jgi:hypothetical protein
VAVPGQKELKTFSFGLRAGLLLGGSGTNKVDCTSGDCSSITAGENDYNHRVSGAFALDFLWKVGSIIRLGPGLAFVAPSSITLKNVPSEFEKYEVGSDLSIDFVLEVVPRVGPAAWLAPRFQLGPTVLFPSGDLKDSLNALKDTCNTSGASGCDSIGGPRPGFNIGLGFGALFGVGDSVRLRADLLAQYYVINLYTTTIDTSFGSFEASRNVGGSRFFLLGGVEF